MDKEQQAWLFKAGSKDCQNMYSLLDNIELALLNADACYSTLHGDGQHVDCLSCLGPLP